MEFPSLGLIATHVLLFGVPMLFAQGTTIQVEETHGRVGEKIGFRVFAEPSEGSVTWTMTKDGKNPPIGRGTLAAGTGDATGTLSEPGFLRCTVTSSSGTAVCEAAVAIDPLSIQPSLPVPEDFDSFWRGQKQRLAEVPLNTQLSAVKSAAKGVEVFDVRADSVGGPFFGYLARPTGAKPASLPAILLPHGAGVRGSRLGVAAAWAADGFLALDFNAHGLPNGQPAAFYAEKAAGELKEYPLRGRGSRDQEYFLGMILRALRAVDIVASQPEWNGHTLIANGRSQGGGQAIAMAGLDPRVSFLVAEVPALCDHTGIVVGRINGWPRLISDNDQKPDPTILEAARYFDAVNFASRVRAPALFTAGFIDRACPPTGVFAAYNQLRGDKRMIEYPQTGHANSPEAEAAVREAILHFLNSTGVKRLTLSQ